MPQRIDQSLSARRLAEYVMLGFAGLALMLAMLGTYGVLSYSIGQRTREIGIRIALGAQRNNILRMVLRKGAALAAFGLASGALAALWLSGFLRSLLFGIRPDDPLTIAAGAAVLVAVTLLACYLPARRAASVDPGITLRSE
jgi:putative ABC transport system permease protein